MSEGIQRLVAADAISRPMEIRYVGRWLEEVD